MIAKVSSSFEHSMAKIGCGGRVELHSPGEKFDEFGIRIMVGEKEGGRGRGEEDEEMGGDFF